MEKFCGWLLHGIFIFQRCFNGQKCTLIKEKEKINLICKKPQVPL
jgi:hypothetical protein